MYIDSKPVVTFVLQCYMCTLIHFTCSGCLAAGKSDRLLDWTTVHHKLPWNVVLLLGSGFALARGAQVSMEWEVKGRRNLECIHTHVVMCA